MFSFKEYMTETQIKEDPSRKAGNIQYQVAARLIAKHQGLETHAGVLQDIERHFSDPRNSEFSHPSGVKVHRYSRSGEGVHDVEVKLPDGSHMKAEVVGGGGKMFASKRGIQKSAQSAGEFLSQGENQHIISKIIRSGINREELSEPETVSRISGGWRRITTKHTAEKGTGQEKHFPGLVARNEHGQHIAMKEIEDHMASRGTTHWVIEGWKIPVGKLSHFIDRVAITQKDPHKEGQKTGNIPQVLHTRLALRGSGVRDPLAKEAKRKGGDTRWHVELDNILKAHYEKDQNVLKQEFGIEKL